MKARFAILVVLDQNTLELCAYAEQEISLMNQKEISAWWKKARVALEQEFPGEHYEFATGIASSVWHYMMAFPQYRSFDWPQSFTPGWPKKSLKREDLDLIKKPLKTSFLKGLGNLLLAILDLIP